MPPPLSFLPFPPSIHAPIKAPLKPRDLGSDVSSHQWRAPPQTHFSVSRAQGTCLVLQINVVLFLINQIQKMTQMWLFLNVMYVAM